jgi:hypothetical protein
MQTRQGCKESLRCPSCNLSTSSATCSLPRPFSWPRVAHSPPRQTRRLGRVWPKHVSSRNQGNLPIQITSRVPSLIIVCRVGHWSSDSAPVGVNAYCSKPTAAKAWANWDTGIASPLVLVQQSAGVGLLMKTKIFRAPGPNMLCLVLYSQEQGDDLVGVRIHERLYGLEVVGQRALVQQVAARVAHLDGAI